MSALEGRLIAQIAKTGLPEPERELCLIPGRRFRCDLIWQGPKLVCEIEGAVWTGGRHTRGGGYSADCEKYNLLTLMGWRVLRVTDKHIRNGEAIQWLTEALMR